MPYKQVYVGQKSSQDGAGASASLDESFLAIARCVDNSEMYVSTSRNYLNASKRAIKDLKDIMIHAEADINTAEECIMESESRLQSLKQELRIIFNKTFYENPNDTNDASDKNDTSSESATDFKYPSLEKLSEFLKKFAEESSLNERKYNISCEKNDGFMFVVMKSKHVNDKCLESSSNDTSDTETQDESSGDLDSLQAEGGRYSKRTTEHIILPRILLKEKCAQTHFNCICEKVPLKEAKKPVESSTQRKRTTQSVSQNFMKQKFKQNKPFVKTENQSHCSKNITNAKNTIFSNEFYPSVTTSYAVNHPEKTSNERESLVNVIYDLGKQCPRSQTLVNDKQTSTSTLNENVSNDILIKTGSDYRQNSAQTDCLNISNSNMNFSNFNTEKSTFILDSKPNRTGSFTKKYESNCTKNTTLKNKAEKKDTQMKMGSNKNLTTEDEFLSLSGSSSKHNVKRGNSIETSTDDIVSRNNPKIVLTKSVSENNLIDFSPKPLSHSYKNMSCYLENRASLMDEPLCLFTGECNNEKLEKFSELGSRTFPVINPSSSSEADYKISNKITGKMNNTLSRFKSFDSLGLVDKRCAKESRSCSSDTLLTPPHKKRIRQDYASCHNLLGVLDPLHQEMPSSSMQANHTFSLPRISSELKKPAPSRFCQNLEEETNLSDISEDSLTTPTYDRSFSSDNEKLFEVSLIEDIYYPKCTSKTVGTSTYRFFGSSGNSLAKNLPENNYDAILAEAFSFNQSETQQLRFPNGEIFSGINADSSESVRVEVSDHSVNNISSTSMKESYFGVSTLKNELEAESPCDVYPRDSTESYLTVSDMSMGESLLQSCGERPSSQDASNESYLDRQHSSNISSTAYQPRSRINSTLFGSSFNPRSESCSSPAPDYSP